MWQMALKVMREEGGVRGLYRGIMATAAGVAPYVGCNFATYEFLRGVITPPDNATVPRKLLCGALAGSISQTLTYPFDVLRRKMQVTAMGHGAMGYKYKGAIDAMRHILRNEGWPGLYRGLWPNLRESFIPQYLLRVLTRPLQLKLRQVSRHLSSCTRQSKNSLSAHLEAGHSTTHVNYTQCLDKINSYLASDLYLRLAIRHLNSTPRRTFSRHGRLCNH